MAILYFIAYRLSMLAFQSIFSRCGNNILCLACLILLYMQGTKSLLKTSVVIFLVMKYGLLQVVLLQGSYTIDYALKHSASTCTRNLIYVYWLTTFYYLNIVIKLPSATYNGRDSKLNRRLTGGSVRVWAISIILNNDNRAEPDGTVGQTPVEFWSRTYVILAKGISNDTMYNKSIRQCLKVFFTTFAQVQVFKDNYSIVTSFCDSYIS